MSSPWQTPRRRRAGRRHEGNRRGRDGAPVTIAITGATGFLGVRLLPRLIERRAPVVVLIHGCATSARDRIMRHLAGEGTPIEPDRDLVVVQTDLTHPRLGLPQWQFRALAEQLTEVWHCAALVDLGASRERVQAVNVAGMQAVLELAGVGTATLYHVSTAFVAGRRRTGLIEEHDLDASYGFETAYEESKFDGEQAVHEWSRGTGRPAVIFRPSVLVSDRPSAPGGPTHLLSKASAFADSSQAIFAPDLTVGKRVAVRIALEPDAHLNLIPVELAAQLMVDLADRVQPQGVYTAHITYPHEVGAATVCNLMEHRYPVSLEFTREPPPDPTPLESLVAVQSRKFAPYGLHNRHYDRGALRAAGLDPSDAPPLDVDYLLRGL